MELTELKQRRDSIQRLFAVLMQGTWRGEVVEPVAQSKLFVDSLYTEVQNKIQELEPKVEAPANESDTSDVIESTAVEQA